MNHGEADSWRCLHAQRHADCRVFSIASEQWQNRRTGDTGTFYVMEVRDWAVAAAQTRSGEIILVQQFRFGSAGMTIELPAGLVDAGEDPAAAAQRELYEESGYRGAEPVKLGEVFPNPAIQRNRCHFFWIANAVRVDAGSPDSHESFRVMLRPLPEVFAMAADGRIQHGIVHACLFFLRNYLDGRPA